MLEKQKGSKDRHGGWRVLCEKCHTLSRLGFTQRNAKANAFDDGYQFIDGYWLCYNCCTQWPPCLRLMEYVNQR